MLCPWCGTPNEGGAESCLTCGKALYALTRGALLSGRYEVLGTLGQGGMGVVYRAYDRQLDEAVAIKVLRPAVAGNPDLARRFRSEIKLARKVRHPNICGIHGFGQDGHLSYIVMEHVDGVDFKHILREEGPLAPRKGYEVAIQVAEGLQAIHRSGIVHRDLKTANIMRDVRGSIRLMDFGIAKDTEAEGAGATATGTIVGTPEYMSPEQARAEKVDHRSDIYSLGVVIFELFTGNVPFHADTPLGTLWKHIGDPPPLDGARAERLPAHLKPILARCLEKERGERFQSAAQLAEALREAHALEDDASPARAPEAWVPSAHRARGGPAAAAAEPVPAAETDPTPVALEVDPLEGESTPLWPPAVVRAANRWGPGVVAGLALLTIAGLGAIVGVGFWRLVQTAAPPSPPPASQPTPLPPAVPWEPPPAAAGAGPSSSLSPVASPAAPAPPPPSEKPLVRLQPVEAAAPPATLPVAPFSAPPPARATAASPAAQEPGRLKLRVVPWAEVAVDGRSVGTTPLAPLALPPGSHLVVLTNPDHAAVSRSVTIRPGETVLIEIDFAAESPRP